MNSLSKKVIAVIFAFSQLVEGSIAEVINQLKAKYPRAFAYHSTEVKKLIKIS